MMRSYARTGREWSDRLPGHERYAYIANEWSAGHERYANGGSEMTCRKCGLDYAICGHNPVSPTSRDRDVRRQGIMKPLPPKPRASTQRHFVAGLGFAQMLSKKRRGKKA